MNTNCLPCNKGGGKDRKMTERMLSEMVKTLTEMYETHGIKNYAIVTGLDQEDALRKLDGFIEADKLENVLQHDGNVITIGRIPACWLVVWDRIPSGYVYTAEVFNGRLRMQSGKDRK